MNNESSLDSCITNAVFWCLLRKKLEKLLDLILHRLLRFMGARSPWIFVEYARDKVEEWYLRKKAYPELLDLTVLMADIATNTTKRSSSWKPAHEMV